MTHDADGELPDIAVPTLVVHGEHDRLIPKANGELIARSIPGAQLHVVRRAGHYYSTDEPAVDGVVSSFSPQRDAGRAYRRVSWSAAGCAQCPYSR